MKDRMAFYTLLQELTNIYSALSSESVTENDFEDMKHHIVHTMRNPYLTNYVLNQERDSWRWNNDMLRVQLSEMARDCFEKFLALPNEQMASYRDCFTIMRSMEVFKFGEYGKAADMANEIDRVWSLERRIDTMSNEFRDRWLNEIVRLAQSFVYNSP